MVISELKSIWFSRDVLWNLTLRELRSKYRRSFLGWSWSMLNPLATVGIFGFVFGVVFGATAPTGNPSGITNFALYLVSGIIPWGFFGLITNLSMSAMLGNAGLVRKVSFARETLVLSQSIFALVQHTIEIAIVIALLALAGSPLWPWLPMTLFTILMMAIFATGIGLVLSVANVYMRDLNYLWSIFLQIWFYACAIVYDPVVLEGKVPKFVEWVVRWNPMSIYIHMIRDTLYHGRGPSLLRVAAGFGYALAAAFIGLIVFRKLNRRLAEEI
jgi:ABC-type polysaccharide/polyol phosphate export permease